MSLYQTGKQSFSSRRGLPKVRIALLAILIVLMMIATFAETNPSFVRANVSATSPLPQTLVPKTTYPCQDLGGNCYSVVVGNSATGTLGVPVAFLAGLQDRTNPEIYLLGDSSNCNPGNGNQDSGIGLDRCWLNYIEKNYPNIKDTTVSENFILTQYQGLVSHNGKVWVVEYSSSDPNFPLEYDMARTIASADMALPVPSGAYTQLLSVYGASNVYLEQDLTNSTGPNSCYTNSDPKLACDQWLLSSYGPGSRTNSNVLATPCNGRFDSTDYYAFTNPLEIVLQSACTNALTTAESTWVTGSLLPLYGSTSSSFKLRTIDAGYTGFGGEVSTVTTLSDWQILYVVMEDDMNLGFMAGLPDYINAQQSAQPVPVYNSNSVYIVFSYTQGNGIMWYQYRYLPIYNNSLASTVVANWQVNGMMAQIAPPILKFWTESQPRDGNQYFTTANSGDGSYLHPQQIPNENYWASAISTPYACNADHPINFVQFNSQVSQTSMQSYANAVSGSTQDIATWAPLTNGNPTGSYPSYDTGNDPAFYQLQGGVVAAINDWWVGQTFDSSSAQQEANMIAQNASTHNQHFFYINFNANAGSFSWLQQVYNDLNAIQANKFVPVSFSNYFALYDQANNITPQPVQCTNSQTSVTSTTRSETGTTSSVTGTTSSTFISSTLTTSSSLNSSDASTETSISSDGSSTNTSPVFTTTQDSTTTNRGSSSLVRSQSLKSTTANAHLPAAQSSLAAGKIQSAAMTMSVGTGAIVLLVGLFPLSHILNNSSRRKLHPSASH